MSPHLDAAVRQKVGFGALLLLGLLVVLQISWMTQHVVILALVLMTMLAIYGVTRDQHSPN